MPYRRDYVYRDPRRVKDVKELEEQREKLDAEAGYVAQPQATAKPEPPYVPDRRFGPKAKRTVVTLPAKRCPQCHFLLSSVVHQLKCAA